MDERRIQYPVLGNRAGLVDRRLFLFLEQEHVEFAQNLAGAREGDTFSSACGNLPIFP